MITVNNLGFGYSRNEGLFDGLTFTVGAGKIYGLLGLNGAGKTTLLKLLSEPFTRNGERFYLMELALQIVR